MKTNGGSMKRYNFTGIGLIFGTALGSLITIIMSLDITWILVGTSAGLIIGAIVDASVSKK